MRRAVLAEQHSPPRTRLLINNKKMPGRAVCAANDTPEQLEHLLVTKVSIHMASHVSRVVSFVGLGLVGPLG